MDANRISGVTPGAGVNGVNPVGNPVSAAQLRTYPGAPVKTFGETFQEALINKGEGLRFSKHASVRLNSREVALSGEQLQRVEDGVAKALGKGVTDSLILVDGYALVVNTRSKTVITALDDSNGKVFTNIDGAVIV